MAKFSAQGSKLQVEIASVLTDIPNIASYNWPEVATQYEDTTALDSAGNFKEYTAIMNDTSEITAEGQWDPSNAVHDFLMDQSVLASKTAINFAAISSATGSSQMAFAAFISMGVTQGQNASQKFTLKLRVTGALTYTQ